MVFLFGKRKQPSQTGNFIPFDLVQRYAAQGMSEHDIASQLKSQGFNNDQIDKALKSALKSEVVGGPPVARHPPQPMEPRPMGRVPQPDIPQDIPPEFQSPAMDFPMRNEQPQFERAPQQRMPPQQMQRQQQQRPQMGVPPERIVPQREQSVMLEGEGEGGFTFEPQQQEQYREPESEITLEEVIEGIVSDKWNDFEDRLTLFDKRDLQLQGQIEDMRKRLEQLEKNQKEREHTLINRFEDFGDSMSSIDGRISSIEKVFKEFLPELTENIKTMSEIVEKAKAEKK